MKTFLKSQEGVLKEILEFEVESISGFLNLGGNFQKVMTEIVKMNITAQSDYLYVAVVGTSGWIDIRYVAKHNIEKVLKKDIGFLVCSFLGDRFGLEGLFKWISCSIKKTWIDLAFMSIKEIELHQ